MSASAVPNVKLTFFLEHTSGPGWSETYYYNNLVNPDDTTLYTDTKNLLNARAKALDGVNVTFQRARLSRDDVQRDVYLVARSDLPLAVGGVFAGGPDVQTGINYVWQTPHVSWPLRLETTTVDVEATQYLAGMPASTTQSGDGPYNSNPPTPASYLNQFASYLKNGPWGAKGLSWPAGTQAPGNSIAVSAKPIWTGPTAMSPATINFPVANWGANPTPSPGDKIRLWGASWNTPLRKQRYNGTWVVQTATAVSATVLAPRVLVDPDFQVFGYLQLSSYDVFGFTGFFIDNITHKKRGRPTSLPRGRRAAS